MKVNCPICNQKVGVLSSGKLRNHRIKNSKNVYGVSEPCEAPQQWQWLGEIIPDPPKPEIPKGFSKVRTAFFKGKKIACVYSFAEPRDTAYRFFVKGLQDLRAKAAYRGYDYIIQHTINGGSIVFVDAATTPAEELANFDLVVTDLGFDRNRTPAGQSTWNYYGDDETYQKYKTWCRPAEE